MSDFVMPNFVIEAKEARKIAIQNRQTAEQNAADLQVEDAMRRITTAMYQGSLYVTVPVLNNYAIEELKLLGYTINDQEDNYTISY